LFANVETGESRVVLTETSATWIDLNDELSFLHKSKEFVWASARDGFCTCTCMTTKDTCAAAHEGPWMVDDFRARAIKAIDEKHRRIYFSATRRARWSGSCTAPRSTRKIPGASSASPRSRGTRRDVRADAAFYVDNFTSVTQPPQVSLHSPTAA